MAEVNLPPTTPEDQKYIIANLHGNSITPEGKKKEEDRERETPQKVISGKVIKKKKSLGRKFADTFIGEDIKDVKSYVLRDVIVPAIKTMITDTVADGIEMIMFGEVRGRNRRTSTNDRGKSYVAYNRISSGTDRPRDRRISRGGYSYDDVILDSRGDAEEVLSLMFDYLEKYGEVKLADLYGMVGESGQFTDNYWGWRDLSGASVKKVYGGYLIDLPRIMNLR